MNIRTAVLCVDLTRLWDTTVVRGSTSTSTSPDVTSLSLEMGRGNRSKSRERPPRETPLVGGAPLGAPSWEPRQQENITLTSASRFVSCGRRLGDEPRGGDESTMSMLEGEEGVRADDDYAKGEDSTTLSLLVSFIVTSALLKLHDRLTYKACLTFQLLL